MEQFPPLVPQDLKLKGQGYLEAIADIKLSSAGERVSNSAANNESDDITSGSDSHNFT